MNEKSTSFLSTRLRNGLEVRLKEIHNAPLISSWLWYRVGSRNELPGNTGSSHWVEHMQFKGTPDHPGDPAREFSRVGGVYNAWTWLDWTVYFETMPADRIDIALNLEADRMLNSPFDPKVVEAERTVIISERQGHENEPNFRLSEEVQAAAFRVSSYHHEVIGDMIDLRTMSRDDLYNHYRTHYNPANAVLSLAGDFKTSSMLKTVRAIFGQLPKLDPPVFEARPEPERQGERIINLEGPGETSYIRLAYNAPPADHDDFLPLAVLDSVLAGASSFDFFSGGISNRTSRLYRALVEGEIAAAVQGGLAATIDPYLYTIHVTMLPDKNPEEALEVLDREFERILNTKIGTDEIAKAIKQAQALFAYSSETITNQAFWMGFSEMFADASWFDSYLERLAQITPERILAVAQIYLRKSNRVRGIYRHAEETKSA
jgi:zinc protease